MSLAGLYKIITSFSPQLEVAIRKLYWNNISVFARYNPKYNQARQNSSAINFDRIIENLRNRGIKNGQILIVHSSYDLLENSGLLPEEINSKLLELVGEAGTLVMPAIRKYKEEGKVSEYLTKNMDDIECTYDVKKSKIISGFLPFMLMQRSDSFISRFPLNPVVAVGKHAKMMVKNNLEGVNLTPHGPNSSWKYCVDSNAIVIGLGVEMPHFLTITHVNEDCHKNWPIKEWYRIRKFEILDNDFKKRFEVLERKPLWGTIYFAENKFKRDLIRNNILKIETVEGLKISIIESSLLINFLQNNPRKGYPYFVRSKFLTND